jgi:uncharacterized membrane protein
MILIGFIFIKYPPKFNRYFGYNTRMSMKNELTWRFAHAVSGQYYLWMGFGLLPSSIGLAISLQSWVHYDDFVMILSYVQIAVLLGVIVFTEVLLHLRFDREGIPK